MITLNEKQKTAIRFTDRPLLISAHPGSGKTRIITEKIKYLLSKNLSEQDILVLTFSKKAVGEIISRLSEDIGFLNSVNIHTFHSFAQNILIEFGSKVELRNDFSVMDDMEAFVFLKNRFFDFDIDLLRPISNPYKYIQDILNFFSKMQDEYIKSDEFIKNKNDDIQKELAILYKEFYALKIKEGKLQYNDLLYLVMDLVSSREDILDLIKKRYKYILVDEFQDTNYIQNLLLIKVSDGKHITVVGDRNQSIYKFRGASLSNFNTFKEEFKNVLELNLDINYRSYQDVLDHSFKFMNMDPIKSIKGYNRDSVNILHFEKGKDEMFYILNKIKKLIESGVLYSDIAVILRTNSMVSDFADAMNFEKIPFYIKGNNGFSISLVVKDLSSLIYSINDKHDNIALLRFLSSGIFNIHGNDIYTFVKEASFQKMSYFEYLELISRQSVDTKISDTNKFIDVFNLLENIFAKEFKNANDLIIYFLDTTDYYTYIETLSDRDIRKDFLEKFLIITNRFKDTSIEIFSGYLAYIDKVSFDDIDIDGEGVVLSTIHGVKGGEFRYVFMPYLADGFFPAIARSKNFEIPKSLIKEKIEGEQTLLDEEKRLFFVGMTRAKEHLSLSFSSFYDGYKREKKISSFLDNIVKTSGYKIQNIKDNNIKDVNTHPLFYIPKDFEIKSYSFSQISIFARCPLQYYYSYILHVSGKPQFSLFYGNVIHNTLKNFLSLPKKSWDKENIESIYLKEWNSNNNKGFLGERHENLYKAKGLKSLDKSIDIIKPKTDKFLLEKSIEYKFKNKYLIKGRIDRVDIFENNSADIIDYKTGSIKTDLTDYKFQLWLYSLAIMETYRIDIKDLVLIFIDDKDKVDINIGSINFREMEAKLLNLLSLMEEMEIKATPSFMCNFCDYRLLCYKK